MQVADKTDKTGCVNYLHRIDIGQKKRPLIYRENLFAGGQDSHWLDTNDLNKSQIQKYNDTIIQ